MYIHYHSDDTRRRRQISCSMRGPKRGGRCRRRGTTDYGTARIDPRPSRNVSRSSVRSLLLLLSARNTCNARLAAFRTHYTSRARHRSHNDTSVHKREKAASGREKSPRDSLPSQHLQNRIHRIELPCSCFHIGLQSFEVLTDMSSAMIRPYMPSADAVPWMSTIPT